MHPKFILVSDPKRPLVGRFVYGMVGQHKELDLSDIEWI